MQKFTIQNYITLHYLQNYKKKNNKNTEYWAHLTHKCRYLVYTNTKMKTLPKSLNSHGKRNNNIFLKRKCL